MGPEYQRGYDDAMSESQARIKELEDGIKTAILDGGLMKTIQIYLNNLLKKDNHE